jgi:hypothetical protein
MDTLVGGFVTLGLGVIVIAAIYQLGRSPNNIAQDIAGTQNSALNVTLGALFKNQ